MMQPADGTSRIRRSRIGSLAGQLGAVTLSRLCLNTARRFAYPFTPALSRGLGVPITAVTSIIAVSQATTMISPVFGPLGDRFGYRSLMLAGLGVMAAGMFAGGLLPAYGVILVSLVMAMLGKSMFDPSVHAYVGGKIPFQRRGLAVGLIEVSWSGSALIGIPLAGLAIENYGWRSPFFILGGLALFSASAIILSIPANGRDRKNLTGNIFGGAWKNLARSRAALGALSLGFLMSAANDNLFIIYGIWLEDSFALKTAALGAATVSIGLAELSGEGIAAMISDYIGLKKAVVLGLMLSAGGYLILPSISSSLPLALTGLFFIFLTFEFTVITSLSLCTELLPQARATMMASFIAVMGFGRVTGALAGGPLWLAGGVSAVCYVSAALGIMAVIVFIVGLRGWINP